MEKIVLSLKFIRGVRGVLLASVVWYHIKGAHNSPGYGDCLNLDKEMIARAPIVGEKLNFRFTQKALDRAYSAISMMHSRLTMPWSNKSSQRPSLTWTHMFIWKRERIHRMVKPCTSMSTSDFSTLTIWAGSPQKQKIRCIVLTMVVREMDGIGTSMLHPTRNNISSWRALHFMATVGWKIAPSPPLFLRNQEHWVRGSGQLCLGPTRKIWYRFWHDCILS